ncbi:MAG: glycosyltransferase family 4 protein [Acidimicrobiia bacterium]|nr:glycosyltransferase family 4 protein [Acidimicrobiia bacterium]
MKIAFVTPRYGAEVAGGAETGARRVAELLATRPGWAIETLTTCALDERTWADHYPPGETEVSGVRVRRFPIESGRHPQFDERSRALFADPEAITAATEAQWLSDQGPVAPALLDAVATSDADVLVFTPYLFDPTVRGLPSVASRAVLVPAAHDEAPIRLAMYRRVFADASGLVFHTEAEQRFVQEHFPVGHHPQTVIGLGCDPAPGEPGEARTRVGLGDRPYVLCLGRVDDGKGTGYLARFFAAYKERCPGPLALVLAGPVHDTPAPHPDIVVTGRVDEHTKWGLLRGAIALVVPSAHESFSIVLLEAWSAGIPVIVNGRCVPTREQCARSGGGLWYGRFATFAATLDRLVESPALRASLAAKGRDYVIARYQWGHVVDRYAAFLELISGQR